MSGCLGIWMSSSVEVLVRMKAVFSKNKGDIGNIEDFKMPINAEDQKPMKMLLRGKFHQTCTK